MSRVDKFINNEGLESADVETTKYLKKELEKELKNAGLDNKEINNFITSLVTMFELGDDTLHTKLPKVFKKARDIFHKNTGDETSESYGEILESTNSIRKIKGAMRELFKDKGSAAIRSVSEVCNERIGHMLDPEDGSAPNPKKDGDKELLSEARSHMKSASRKLRKVKEAFKTDSDFEDDDKDPDIEPVSDEDMGKNPLINHTPGKKKKKKKEDK